jgi:hypothetical protein
MRHAEHGAIQFLCEVHKGLKLFAMAGVVPIIDFSANSRDDWIDYQEVATAGQLLCGECQPRQVLRGIERRHLAVLVSLACNYMNAIYVSPHLNQAGTNNCFCGVLTSPYYNITCFRQGFIRPPSAARKYSRNREGACGFPGFRHPGN